MSGWCGRMLLYCLAGAVVTCRVVRRAGAPPVETWRQGAGAKTVRGTLRADEYRVRVVTRCTGIAWQQGVDYRLIAAWNGIRPPHIFTGQTLRLAASGHKPPPPASTTAARPTVNPVKTAPAQTRTCSITDTAACLDLACSWPDRIVVQGG